MLPYLEIIYDGFKAFDLIENEVNAALPSIIILSHTYQVLTSISSVLGVSGRLGSGTLKTGGCYVVKEGIKGYL